MLKRLLLALLFIAVAAPAEEHRWQGLRDGVLYLRPSAWDALDIDWQAAWQSEANHEQLYLLDGVGHLAQQVEIAAERNRGERRLDLAEGNGDYALHIPGYSFRSYRVSHGAGSASQFEPAKLHFSAEVADGTTLYFRVGPGQQVRLAGKNHGGVHALQATRLSDNAQVQLELLRYDRYARFDQASLPLSPREEIWRLELVGSGKAAFWLDGGNNLFALAPEQLFRLQWRPGTVQLRLRQDDLGPAPRLGSALPYGVPEADGMRQLAAIAGRAGAYYSFVDVLPRQPQREIAFRQAFQERLGIDQDITLLAGSGRRAVLDADPSSFAGLDAWLADTARLPGKGLHYLAFADEPNLNYPDYASYADYFGAMLRRVQASPGARAAGVRIAMPASSRLLDGPFRNGAAQRRGLDWARQLLAEHGNDIDALAWHEWMLRDLLATRRYRDSVRQAADLVGLDLNGRPRKALLLDQTNISSGDALSPYQQNSQFAALWWASVVFNASQDGLLDMLIWFQAMDEDAYTKGMLNEDATGTTLKPVGLAQRFILQHWLAQVQGLDNPAFEVDALALRDGKRHSLLGVNKVPRQQAMEITGAALCAARPSLRLFDSQGLERDWPLTCEADRARFDLPGESLFALTWEAT
ncbi:hypothetical protein [Pseudomonas panipatensis]|uniref:Uncharacterized protein n=1 Tax=Pseudomonas panipatensis TaxID=428992 RepID=A0A1G8IMU9_9PSED|nr:hypothetical protein [Pseudomonas panipatensis]SDI20234.1 hypothetical protein SAMN05216272_106354 [Pseudomonas panipatensis]SMP73462.1 hypothetical protein SAMN06295951_11214 [Pseudomonas panipatensis]